LSYLANTQTDKQTNKVRQKHYLLGGGHKFFGHERERQLHIYLHASLVVTKICSAKFYMNIFFIFSTKTGPEIMFCVNS